MKTISYGCVMVMVAVHLSGPIATTTVESPSVTETCQLRSDANKDGLKIMTWNIWHGGREDGEKVGPQRVVDVIRDCGADLVAMQETYGSGERIAKELGFQLHARGTNLSIHSRFPIREDISVFEEFKCVGALIDVPQHGPVAFYCIWLPYGKDIWLPEIRRESSDPQMLAACQPSAQDLTKILVAIQERLAAEKYRDVSLVIAGDFNSMSHLDWSDVAADQFGRTIGWPTSQLMTEAQFRDSYRELTPVIDRVNDFTWSPRFPEQEQERIDYIYYKSKLLRAVEAKVIREHRELFPSDHAAIVTTFENLTTQEKSNRKLEAPPTTGGNDAQETNPTGEPNQSHAAAPTHHSPAPLKLTAATYNIRRGLGTDNRADLERTMATIGRFEADIVGLQEVDMNVNRSGNVNQAFELGKRLGMHAAFGPFFDYDGGKYGMALLTRYPIRKIDNLRLPDGNEPRIALVVEVVLPDDETILVVNVHFDWVADDTFRFAQAEFLHAYLLKQKIPFVLLGDFNDTPGSRTVDLFGQLAAEAAKPGEESNTFPAEHPIQEIDYLFAGPKNRWHLSRAQVIAEPLTSDHRPVIAKFQLLKNSQ